MSLEQQISELQKKYPKWLLRVKDGRIYGFCNLLSCITESEPETPENSFPVAVRVSIDGVYFFSKEKEPNLYFLKQGNYLTLEEVRELKNEEVHPIQVGEGRIDGSISFADCVYEPGIQEPDYFQLRNLFHEIIRPYVTEGKAIQ